MKKPMKLNCPIFQNLPPRSSLIGLNPKICSLHQQENDDVLCHGDFTDNVSEEILDTFWPDTPQEYATKGYFGIASPKKKNSS